jgi:hypothetical protein
VSGGGRGSGAEPAAAVGRRPGTAAEPGGAVAPEVAGPAVTAVVVAEAPSRAAWRRSRHSSRTARAPSSSSCSSAVPPHGPSPRRRAARSSRWPGAARGARGPAPGRRRDRRRGGRRGRRAGRRGAGPRRDGALRRRARAGGGRGVAAARGRPCRGGAGRPRRRRGLGVRARRSTAARTWWGSPSRWPTCSCSRPARPASPRALELARGLGHEVGLLRHERALATPDDAAAFLADPLLAPELRAALAGA